MPARLLILPLFLLTVLAGHTQSRYNFFTLGTEQGLSGAHVWSICQDKYGFIWLGTTNGVNRFDGHNVRSYLPDPKDSFALPGSTIYWIFRDRDGDIWFACGRQGLARYNYTTDRFERLYAYDSLRRSQKIDAPVWRIGEDQMGRIYLACGGACLRFTKQSGRIEDLTPLFNGAIKDYGVAMFTPQGKDRLWICTDNGLFLYNLYQNKVTPIPFDKEKMGYGLAAMHDAEFVNEEELLITMGRPGFVFYNTRTGKFRPPPPPFDPAVSKKFSEAGGVTRDAKGRIWISSSSYGLVEYLPATNTTYSMKAEPTYPYPFPEQEGQGMNVYADRDGNIWYATSLRGAVWFQPALDFIKLYTRDYASQHSLPDNLVMSFAEKGEEVFMGTGKGFSRLDAYDQFHNFPASSSTTNAQPSSPVRSIAGSSDTLFIGTANGLSLFHSPTGRFIHPATIPFDAEEPAVQQVLPIAHGDLLLVNGRIKRFREGVVLPVDHTDPLYGFRNVTHVAHHPGHGILWIASGNSVYEYSLRNRTSLQHHLFATSGPHLINFLKPDGNKLWVGTPGGLYSYLPGEQKLVRFPLPTASQAAVNMCTEDPAYTWVTTANEIIRLDRGSGRSATFDLHVLLPNSTINRNALLFDRHSRLWIGTNKGFCVVDTRRFRVPSIITEPRLVNFSVFDKRRTFSRPYFDLKRLELDHDENFFSFDVSALDFHQTAGIRYACRLENFDKDWKTLTRNSASYTNVPPGHYRLRLRTLHSSGLWKEAAPVDLYIHPPFWETSWFLGLLILLALVMAWVVYAFLVRRKRRRDMEATIDYFANSLYGDNSVSEICWDIARNCIAQLKLEDCVVYLLDEQRGVLVQKAAYGPKNPREHEIVNPLEIALGEGIVGTAAATARPVWVKDTTKDKRYILDDHHRLSELAVPIIHEGKAIGVIDSEHPKKNFFTSEHVKVLSTIAAISANKIAEAKAEALARESEIQLLEIRKLLAESQLMALRAQMNPHFVFNCLNSIQECIVTEKYGEASRYLNKFSKLFRSVLNNSGKVMVTLAEEIEVLELYLSLEHMRFAGSFTYRIEVDEDLETEEILIPSMLLQPYVENALWHGLMHKENDRKLLLCFEKMEEDTFRCVIDDNGIGRARALELKEAQGKTRRHVSRGMSISRDRVELLQKQGQHARLEIIDKTNGHGASAGTRVVLELSTYLKAT